MRSLVAFALIACGCGGAYSPRFRPVDSDGRALRDGSGRTLLLRGVNARVSGVVDVAELRAAGFNLLRLPIDWSGIEPARGAFDSAYLDRVEAVIDLLRGSGVYVLLDFHEDGYSKELCEDGAPLWAIDPPPSTLVGGPGPLAGPTDCHTSSAALAAFAKFFADSDGLQEEYVTMASQVAMRFRSDTQVLGYEIMNEPIGVDTVIASFNQKVAAALRAIDTDHLILFEPAATRNFTNASPISSTPFPVGGAVYAVHVYTAVFGNNASLDDGTYPPALANSVSGAREEADAWGTPLIITEYGIGSSSPRATQWLGHFLDDTDAQGASSALWLWKEESQGEWGLYQVQPDGSFAPRPEMFQAVSRPYPQAIGGDLVS